ncbi:alcohol dehydrogenase [Novosphingobium sp. 9U]|uniref:alcohol dehydrogenase n=1 Tax=Novosphingobium sp. 9U TaxID=2653158 RepID=UPI0012EF1714|nr:alcohol dehydrogenase [Novosphingobium sp. 9U]VWX49957.1 Alcohol dehydrogenase [Novosphingobium sp. 9U]
MEAYAIIQHGRPLEKVSRPTPVPVGREVLVAVTHSGICHSDLHVIEGHYDLGSRGDLELGKRGLTLPLIPGHEVVGKVVSWGPEADGQGLVAGDLKLVFPWVGCGECSRCRADEQNLCLSTRPMGLVTDGGYGTHVLVSDPKYLLDIEGLDPAVAATYACSGVTVFSAIRKLMPLDHAETIVVIGAGGLGLNAISLLRALGHERICAVDTGQSKLDAAVAQGAASVVLADGDSASTVAKIAAACDGRVFSIIDTVNASPTAEFAFDALSKGGKLVQVGLFGGELKLPLPLMPAKSATLQGSYVGGLAELREVVSLAKQGLMPAIPVTPRNLDDVNEALDELRDGRVIGRMVIVLDADHQHPAGAIAGATVGEE